MSGEIVNLDIDFSCKFLTMKPVISFNEEKLLEEKKVALKELDEMEDLDTNIEIDHEEEDFDSSLYSTSSIEVQIITFRKH